jgi:hypothetical protein
MLRTPDLGRGSRLENQSASSRAFWASSSTTVLTTYRHKAHLFSVPGNVEAAVIQLLKSFSTFLFWLCPPVDTDTPSRWSRSWHLQRMRLSLAIMLYRTSATKEPQRHAFDEWQSGHYSDTKLRLWEHRRMRYITWLWRSRPWLSTTPFLFCVAYWGKYESLEVFFDLKLPRLIRYGKFGIESPVSLKTFEYFSL